MAKSEHKQSLTNTFVKNIDFLSFPSSCNTCSIHIASNPTVVTYSLSFSRPRSMDVGAFFICTLTKDKSAITSSMFSRDMSQLPFQRASWGIYPRFCQKIYRMSILERTRDSSSDNFLDSLLHRDKYSYADCQGHFFVVFLIFFCLGGK